MKKIISFCLIAGVFAFGFAGNVGAATIDDLMKQIQALQAQLQALQTQQTALQNTVQTIVANLSFGMTNSTDVKALQQALKTKGFFNGDITGNFFNQTLQAVKAFQAAQGIEQTGFVGNQTKSALGLTPSFLEENPLDTAGGGGTTTGTSTAAPSVTITANPTIAGQGQAVTLSWYSPNSSTCYVPSNLAWSDWSGNLSTTGSKSVNPSSDWSSVHPDTPSVTYWIYCSNSAGTGKASVYVPIPSVGTSNSAPFVTLTATPSVVTPGQPVTLTATATNNPTTCISTIIKPDGTFANGPGTYTVTPTVGANQSQTWAFSCSNSAGNSNNAQVTVTVQSNTTSVSIPVVTLNATPSTITAGQLVQLNATNNLLGQNGTCTLNGQPTALGGGPNGSGMSPMTVIPTQTTTYTYTCTNSAGSNSASATVTVQSGTGPTAAPPGVTITATPSTITAGQSSQINWTSNLTSCSSPSWSLGNPIGGAVVYPNQTTTYNITCTNSSGQSASASVTVTVQLPAGTAVVSLTASPSSITAGQSSTLTLSAPGASYCSVTPSSSYGGGVSTSFTVSPAQTTIYTANCYFPNAAVQYQNGSATVTVTGGTNTNTTTAAPSQLSLVITASPSTVSAGGASTVKWSVSGGTMPIYCYQSWNPSIGYQSTLGSTSIVGNLQSSTNFTVSCKDSGGLTTSGSAYVTVTPATTSNVYSALYDLLKQLSASLNH